MSADGTLRCAIIAMCSSVLEAIRLPALPLVNTQSRLTMNNVEEELNGHESFLHPVMDEDDAIAEQLHDMRCKCVQWIIESVRMIKSYQGNRDFALDCWAISLGEIGWPIVGATSQAKLAEKYGMTKANVCKLVNKFQGPAFLNLPPAGGQRSLNGRKSMVASRIKQLTK